MATKEKIKGVISVGSNYVHLAKEYKEWTERGAESFLLFEPVAETFALLQEELFYKIPAHLDARTDLKNFALGNYNGKAVMNIEKNNKGQSSSILKPKLHLVQYPWIKFTETEEVDIYRLDDVDYDRSLYDFLHIDTQGYDLEVLKGGVESLKSINEVEVEVSFAELYENCPMHEEVTAFMVEQGFSLKGIHMWCDSFGDATYKRI